MIYFASSASCEDVAWMHDEDLDARFDRRVGCSLHPECQKRGQREGLVETIQKEKKMTDSVGKKSKKTLYTPKYVVLTLLCAVHEWLCSCFLSC